MTQSTTADVVLLSQDKVYTFNLLRQKTDKEIGKIYKAVCDIVLYYENTDSFEQGRAEKAKRVKAYDTRAEIEEYVQRFRPHLTAVYRR